MRALPHPARLVASMALFAISALAAPRDTGFYPLSSRPPEKHPAPPLVIEKLWEVRVPGWPEHGPGAPPIIAVEPSGALAIRTAEGRFRIDPAAGSMARVEDAASAEPPVESKGEEERSLEWLDALDAPKAVGEIVSGARGMVAVLHPSGTIEGRLAKNGHLLWRRQAAHRVSQPGASFADYLIVAPDASRSLQAFRWSDGSLAGRFDLDAADSYLVSLPVVSEGRLFVLAVDPPQSESRLLALSLGQQ